MCAAAMVGEGPAQPAATGVFRATRTSSAAAADRRAEDRSGMLASSFLQQKMRNIFVFGAVNRQRLPHDQQAGDGRFAVFPPETWKGGVR
jgi:hypothetical protein